MNNIINISKVALNKLKNIAIEHNTNKIIFFVKGGGCNGFNYKIEPHYENPKKLDEVIKYDNIDIIVCNKSIIHLLGTHIDWKKDIMGETFHFENPNAGAKCGCGTSFTPKI
tara:strand:+ start:996 stop:1331 length:336 start_codon:yes stop_codon:yes gene_type:complete